MLKDSTEQFATNGCHRPKLSTAPWEVQYYWSGLEEVQKFATRWMRKLVIPKQQLAMAV